VRHHLGTVSELVSEPVGGSVGNHGRLQAESRVSLLVVCNRWPGAVIGHIRDCCPKGLNSGDGFNGLMGGQSLAGFGCSLSDLVYKAALNGFGIRSTADPAKADKRTRSKWSRVMRYAAGYKPDSEPLDRFIKRKGGINECAGRFARCLGRHKANGSQRRTARGR
jgi:hypothetical protein